MAKELELIRKNGDVFKLIVDDDFYYDKSIYVSAKGYAMISLNSKNIPLHRYILNASSGEEVDHRNRNRMDNRKCNLRIATRSQNCQNRDMKGYHYCKRDKRFIVRIQVNGKRVTLGRFKTEEEAINCYKEGKLKYHENPWEA